MLKSIVKEGIFSVRNNQSEPTTVNSFKPWMRLLLYLDSSAIGKKKLFGVWCQGNLSVVRLEHLYAMLEA